MHKGLFGFQEKGQDFCLRRIWQSGGSHCASSCGVCSELFCTQITFSFVYVFISIVTVIVSFLISLFPVNGSYLSPLSLPYVAQILNSIPQQQEGEGEGGQGTGSMVWEILGRGTELGSTTPKPQ